MSDFYYIRTVGPSGATRYLGLNNEEVHDSEDAMAFSSPHAAQIVINNVQFLLTQLGKFVPYMDVQKVDDPEWVYG